MTKAITGAAAMQLVEKGRIGLEQPMGDVLPLVRDVKVLEGFDGDGTPRLRDPKTPVTLRHLLTHTAGYGYDIFNPDLARYVQIAGLPTMLSRKNDALRVPLLFDPGSGWEYGIGLDLVGKVIEEVTGEDLESYFRRYILDPLGMHDSPALALEVETFPGQIKKWGLTFLINTEDIEGFRSAGSLTWGGVHNTYFWIDLKKRITAVALMQILPIGDPIVQETMIAFERALYAAIA
jgi:CubicO group peptidase (beta-lactamase class C family)